MRQLTNKKKIYFYFFIFIFLTTAINTNYSKNFLKYLNVKSIDIIGLDFEDQIRLKKNLDILKNKNIFLIKDDELLNILQKYNEFEDYKIQKIFPKKLKIEIRKTAYIAKTLIDMNSGDKLAVVAPRDHAKSTFINLIYPLHRILFGEEKFLLLISESEMQSKYNLEAIGNEIEFNPKIKYFFGYRKGPIWGKEEKEIITIFA